VKVDKQVSCDGGQTFHDVGLVTSPDGTTDYCAGWNAFNGMPAEAITVRYKVQNTGGVAFSSCEITESNAGIGGSAQVPPLAAGGTSDAIDRTPLCSDTLDDSEPDTASVLCQCNDQANPGRTATASDDAKFVCLTPGLNVMKTCADKVNGSNAITVKACNTGTAPLSNCNLTENVYTAEPTCAKPLEGASVPATTDAPANFSLAAGACRDITGSVANLATDACNFASVECTITGTTKKVSDDDVHVCRVPQEFTCRTPGFWGTHAEANPSKHNSKDITGYFLGSGLEVCGVNLTNTTPLTCNSAQEAMCVSVRGNQVLQLARQLTAAKLNCAATTNTPGGDCPAGAINDLIDQCNQVCIDNKSAPNPDINAVGACISAVDASPSLPQAATTGRFPASIRREPQAAPATARPRSRAATGPSSHRATKTVGP
jgi:hypothetical protein